MVSEKRVFDVRNSLFGESVDWAEFLNNLEFISFKDVYSNHRDYLTHKGVYSYRCKTKEERRESWGNINSIRIAITRTCQAFL